MNPNIDLKSEEENASNPTESQEQQSVEHSAQPTSRLRKGEQIVIAAESAAFNGVCVGRHEGMAIFLSGCVPGDQVRAMITKKKKSYAEARVQEILSPGPDRIEPPCMYFGDCGGCTWQHLRYGAQARMKEELLRRLLGKQVSADAARAVAPIVATEPPWGFREKVQLAIRGKAGAPTVGFYRYLYEAVGKPWHWVDRHRMTDLALGSIICDPLVEIWVPYVGGVQKYVARCNEIAAGGYEGFDMSA